MYWQAMCLRASDPISAMKLFETAFHRFKAEKDVKGQYKTWLIVVESMALQFDDLTPLNLWITEYENLKNVIHDVLILF